MEVASHVTSKGQITIPAAVRRALGLEPGDRVVFRVERGRAILAKRDDLLDLAGSVPVPPSKRGMSWAAVRREARAARPR